VKAFAYNVGASTAATYKDYPALQAALIDSEIRDSTEICFHDHGRTIPAEVSRKDGVSYTKLEKFPAARILEDNDDILNYYQWFWQNGDGWNEVFSSAAEGFQSACRTMWTFYDPAVRVPSISGSGGAVDFISHWTYTYPDPLKIARAADELFAMGKLSKKPKDVMKMTQIIWYRSAVVPVNIDPGVPLAQWEIEQPDGPYITVAPDHLREAFWTKIARPVKGIMYHGWESLVPSDVKTPYICTHKETKEVLQELITTVVRPLGPMLMQVPDRKADIAYLESFTSQMFAAVGDYGWGDGWGNDAYLILNYAQLQPEVVYEETLLHYGLKDYKVLVLAECPVLTRSVVKIIKDFQNNGGLLIADEMLVPEIHPDILLESYKRQSLPDQDKQILLDKTRALRKELDPFYSRFADSSNPNIVVRARQYGSTDYLFAVNDDRTYGNYVGHHRLVMEEGIPAHATLSVIRPSGFVYDLAASRRVNVTFENGALQIDAALERGGGKLYMITAEPIDRIRIDYPQAVRCGKSIRINVDVEDRSNRDIDAVVPLDIQIVNADNEVAEFSGFYGASGGHLELSLDIAANENPGNWRIIIKDLASGVIANGGFAVEKN